MLGWRRDLRRIYAATDVFLLTSRNEGTPVALIEAMASGVPGVSTDVGGVGDVIHDASVGRLAAFRRCRRPGRGGHRACSADEDARQESGAAARAHVLGRYGVDRLVNDIDSLYQRLAARRN